MIDTRSRFLGALLGLACGDAVGTTVEFAPRGSFSPVTDMVGGGPFSLQPGQWTDDTSMALCLAESLLTKNAFDPVDQMARYLNWWKWGYLSSTGSCFDIGTTVREALAKFSISGDPYCGSSDPYSAGNGSLMRLAPVVLFAHDDVEALHKLSADSSRTTHGAAEAIECCQLFAELISKALCGTPKSQLFSTLQFAPYQPRIVELVCGTFMEKEEGAIRGSGYCIESLEAALWCFFHTDSFEEAVLRAVNLGDDADTTGAIVGQVAGAYYGVENIPPSWINKLSMREDIEQMANRFYTRFDKSSFS
ncbi:MAG: ADP-ribosylglycohydrolase family protein [Burkholderiales bacterium]|nr:ADP-ribosylglycohydrolase family protein [Burkholderiales bacterium]